MKCSLIRHSGRASRLHSFRVVVPGVVQKQVDQPFASIHRLDRDQQHNRAEGIDRRNLEHAGLAGLKINRTMDVQVLAATGLRHGQLGVFRIPATHQTYRMRRMHRIREQHYLIGASARNRCLQASEG
jgi:hypothetical protein